MFQYNIILNYKIKINKIFLNINFNFIFYSFIKFPLTSSKLLKNSSKTFL